MNKLISLVVNRWSLVIIVIIITAFFRLYNIIDLPPGLYPDEAIYANNGVEAWETGNFKIFYPENNGREGLWPNIIGFFIIKFGHEPWVPRSVAAIFGILTVLGVYFLTKELFAGRLFSDGTGRSSAPAAEAVLDLSASESRPSVGNQASDASETFRTKTDGQLTHHEIISLLSSFFLAISFWHILFSRIGFRAIMAPFFLVWGIYFLLLAFRQIKEQKKPKFYIPSSILSGIFYGLGFHSYIAYRATPLLILIILLFYWFQNKEWQIRKKILLMISIYTLMTIIVAAPLGLYFLKNPRDFLGRTSQISIFNSPTPIKDLSINVLKTAAMFNFSGDFNWRHNYAGKPLLFWPIGILLLIGIFLTIKTSIQVFNKTNNLSAQSTAPPSVFLILISWLIITALPVVISNEGQPHALRAILMAPAIFILAGIGGVWFYNFIKNLILKISAVNHTDKILNAFVVTLLILLIFEAYNSYFIKWGRNPNIQGAFSANYIEIGRQLNNLPKETPKYIIVEAGGTDVRGIPMPTQTIMFITDTFTPEKQKEKNIFYVLPEQKNQIPENGYITVIK